MPQETKRPLLPYGRQWIDEDDIAAVVETLRSPHLTQGPKVAEFERELCKLTGARYAVAVNSATSGLHIACLAAGLKPGDEAIAPPITFVATTNAVLYCGAKPVFADIDSDTVLIRPDQVTARITAKTRAILPVHFAGQSANMEALQIIAQEAQKKHGHKVYVIEDAAHAIGGRYKDSPIGSCKYSDMAVLSFHPVKHITTGEGGAVLTNDPELYRKLCLFRSHGVTRDDDMIEDHSLLPWGYEQHELGYNYRITDIQCALGISQMKKLQRFVERRQEIVRAYDQAFANHWTIHPLVNKESNGHAYHLYVIRADFEKAGGRNTVMTKLRERGVITQVHYIPVHTQPYYRKHAGTRHGDHPHAEAHFRQCLSIPLFPSMKNEDVSWVTQSLLTILSG